MTVSTCCNLTHSKKEVHSHVDEKKSSKLDLAMKVLERVSAIALAAFSLYTNWQLFVPFFALGVAVGIYGYFHATKHEQCGNGQGSGCSSILERLTGVELPPAISLLANIAVTICHIDHHDTVFVPIVGLSIGAWAGEMATYGCVLLHRKITNYQKTATV